MQNISYWNNLHQNIKAYFLRKITKHSINLSSAKLTQRVVTVKVIKYLLELTLQCQQAAQAMESSTLGVCVCVCVCGWGEGNVCVCVWGGGGGEEISVKSEKLYI